MHPASSFDLTYYHQQTSRIALAKKDMAASLEHMRIASKYAEQLGAPFLQGMAECVFSYYLIESGKTAEAKKRLVRLKKLAADNRSLLLDNIRLMNEGLLFLNAGKERECVKSLSRALALASSNGVRFLTLNLPESSSRLLAVAVKAEIEPGFTADLIRANALVCPDSEIECWPWQLKVRTLGPFEVWNGEEKIQSTRKAKQKPLDLLKTIIILGGASISERSITDMLWPEAEGDAAHSAFATTLHRLRQLIGGDKFLELKNGKLTLDARYCWVDTWALEAALRRAEGFLKTGLADSAFKDIDRALELYRGDFLAADSDMLWTAQVRSRLRERMCKALLRAAERLISSGKASRAAEYLQAGMAIDDCAEGLYQRLLEIHIAAGRRREAAALYVKLRECLSSKLAIEPAQATKAIIKGLSKNYSNL
jgi:DNA-binding SARP family transcriptional activator